MERYRRWLDRKTVERCAQNLKRNGFDVRTASAPEAACQEILAMISEFETFGIGGSETIRQIGIIDELSGMGKTVHDHWLNALSPEDVQAVRLQQGRCDCFLCSANAISAQGEIVNVDGIGNRVTAMTYGPRKVVVVAGVNKIAPNLEQALLRVRTVAGPMRAKSLGMDTPCAETGECADCHSPQRICRITTILHRRPMLTDISVVLIALPLGY
ncbi:MAG TPA: lactate utilization protein [Desulfosarcina sp.]|nr:lactate utilization protein [Desulfosarcina sp.]